MPDKKLNKDCPCTKDCPRHANCEECQAKHAEAGVPTACQRLAQADVAT